MSSLSQLNPQTTIALAYFPPYAQSLAPNILTQNGKDLPFATLYTGGATGVTFLVKKNFKDPLSQSQNVVLKVNKYIHTRFKDSQREFRNHHTSYEIAPSHTPRPLSLITLCPSRRSDQENSENLNLFHSVQTSEYGGQDLFETYIRDELRPSAEEFVSITYQLILYYEALHKNGFVHSDLSESNVVISGDVLQPGSLKIIDFEKFYPLKERETPLPYYRMSPQFQSPTLLYGNPDLAEFSFALGNLLYLLITGCDLFSDYRGSDANQNIQMSYRLQKIFSRIPPSPSFFKKIPPTFFNVFFEKVESLDPKKVSTIRFQEQYRKIFKQNAINCSLSTWIEFKFKKSLGEENLHKLPFDDIKDLLLLLLNYENPPTPEDLKKCSLFSKYSEIVSKHERPDLPPRGIERIEKMMATLIF